MTFAHAPGDHETVVRICSEEIRRFTFTALNLVSGSCDLLINWSNWCNFLTGRNGFHLLESNGSLESVCVDIPTSENFQHSAWRFQGINVPINIRQGWTISKGFHNLTFDLWHIRLGHYNYGTMHRNRNEIILRPPKFPVSVSNFDTKKNLGVSVSVGRSWHQTNWSWCRCQILWHPKSWCRGRKFVTPEKLVLVSVFRHRR